jgi:hypothetical protein
MICKIKAPFFKKDYLDQVLFSFLFLASSYYIFSLLRSSRGFR